MAEKDELGRRGERIAERFLEDAGLDILDRNWRCSIGELDLVARDGDETVFIEVKTRSGQAYGHPFEAITPAKLARLRRLAYAWCATRGAQQRIRVDAISVLAPKGGVVVVEHLVDVG
jgi:putative endonuclease